MQQYTTAYSLYVKTYLAIFKYLWDLFFIHAVMCVQHEGTAIYISLFNPVLLNDEQTTLIA